MLIPARRRRRRPDYSDLPAALVFRLQDVRRACRDGAPWSRRSNNTVHRQMRELRDMGLVQETVVDRKSFWSFTKEGLKALAAWVEVGVDDARPSACRRPTP
jgi:hypothetical protein